MTSDYEQIDCSASDLRALDEAGIRTDDIINVVHKAANLCNELMLSRARLPNDLTAAKRRVTEEGASVDRDASSECPNSEIREQVLAWMRHQLDLTHVRQNSLGGTQVAELLGVQPSRVHQMASRGHLYSFEETDACEYFPLWQFYGDQPIPGLRELMNVFDNAYPPRIVHRFMTREHPRLRAVELALFLSPRDWLIAGYPVEPVLKLARALQIVGR